MTPTQQKTIDDVRAKQSSLPPWNPLSDATLLVQHLAVAGDLIDELQSAITAIQAERDRYKKALEIIPDVVPTSWLDSLLTGPDAVISKACDSREIEALL